MTDHITDPFRPVTVDEVCERLRAFRPELSAALRNPQSNARALATQMTHQMNTVLVELREVAERLRLGPPPFDVTERLWARFEAAAAEAAVERATARDEVN